MSQYFPKPYEPFDGSINVRLDLSNYATKADIKNITHIDTSSFALKTNLVNLKSEVDKLDVNKLKPIPTELRKLSDVVKNDVVKKADNNILVTKVDNIDTSGLVKKTDYNTKITKIEDKIPDTSNFVKKTDYNSKITEIEYKTLDTNNLGIKTALTTVENKIPDTRNLATKTALNTVENKIPDINGLVKKTDYNIDIAGIKFIVNKLKAYDSSYFKGKQYFDEESGKQNYLEFRPMGKYFKLNSVVGITDCVLSWRSKGTSDESIKPPTLSNNSLNPRLSNLQEAV